LGNLSAPPDPSRIFEALDRFRAQHPDVSFPLSVGEPGWPLLFQQIMHEAEKGSLDEALALAYIPMSDVS
jgi:hypothetical protein